jgi:hypothetical protein
MVSPWCRRSTILTQLSVAFLQHKIQQNTLLTAMF